MFYIYVTEIKKGLKIARHYTKTGADPLENISYELRTSRITNPDGSTVFEMKNVEVPETWSPVATDILAQKYFRKKGFRTNLAEETIPNGRRNKLLND